MEKAGYPLSYLFLLIIWNGESMGNGGWRFFWNRKFYFERTWASILLLGVKTNKILLWISYYVVRFCILFLKSPLLSYNSDMIEFTHLKLHLIVLVWSKSWAAVTKNSLEYCHCLRYCQKTPYSILLSPSIILSLPHPQPLLIYSLLCLHLLNCACWGILNMVFISICLSVLVARSPSSLSPSRQWVALSYLPLKDHTAGINEYPTCFSKCWHLDHRDVEMEKTSGWSIVWSPKMPTSVLFNPWYKVKETNYPCSLGDAPLCSKLISQLRVSLENYDFWMKTKKQNQWPA